MFLRIPNKTTVPNKTQIKAAGIKTFGKDLPFIPAVRYKIKLYAINGAKNTVRTFSFMAANKFPCSN